MFLKEIFTTVVDTYFIWTTDKQCQEWHGSSYNPARIFSHRVKLIPAGSPGLRNLLIPEYSFVCIYIEPLQSDRPTRKWAILDYLKSMTHPGLENHLNQMPCPPGHEPVDPTELGYGRCFPLIDVSSSSKLHLDEPAVISKSKKEYQTPSIRTETRYFDYAAVLPVDSHELKCIDEL